MTTFNFAHQVISNLDSQINAVSNEIAELEQHLAKLRDAQKRIENERQAMLTLAKAGESALEQAANFLNMAKAAGREDMLQAFWTGIDSLRHERPQLTAWDEAEAEIMAMEPNQPIDPTEGVIPTDDAIDIAAEPITDNTQLIGTESQNSTHSPESPGR